MQNKIIRRLGPEAGKSTDDFSWPPATKSTNAHTMKTIFIKLPQRMFGLALIAALSVLATGCMSFHGGQLARLDAIDKPAAPVAEKVRLEIATSRDGKPFEQKALREWHTKIAMKALAKSGLFGDILAPQPGAAGQPGEFVLKYNIDNWGSTAAAAGSGFLSGLTLVMFPGIAVDHFTVQAEVLNSEGKVCWQKKYDDKVTTVIWLGFFPCLFVPPCYPTSVVDSTMNNFYQHSFKDMLENKAFVIPPPPASGTLPIVSETSPATTNSVRSVDTNSPSATH